MSEIQSYYIEVFNTLSRSKGFVVKSDDSFAITDYPIPAMLFFPSPEQAQQYIAVNKIDSEHFQVTIKEHADLIAEGAITVISVKGWYIANDDGWKLCYNHLTNVYQFEKREDGYLLWLDKKIADKAVIKFTKHFNRMPLLLQELKPQA